ncbi:MAG: response regulator [Candidatus Omnitrophica bacterium]|nr:response regulator [Candidatus Omnitrophota bacterium]MBI5024846.1 response regulator [Candidatus Omnitrophota bacterium]
MSQKKILVVDDEIAMTKVVEIRLRAAGYDVVLAHDGQEGLEKARTENPDLMILDLMLPKMDGFKVCGLLKSDARYKKIPIIIYTARVQDSDQQLGKEVGADAYITKPFDPQVLLGKVKELLAE